MSVGKWKTIMEVELTPEVVAGIIRTHLEVMFGLVKTTDPTRVILIPDGSLPPIHVNLEGYNFDIEEVR